MRKFLQDLLQGWAIRTQVPPFTWAYERVYDRALRFAVTRLRNSGGVLAIYLVSGILDEPIYGLSDIDLVVVVQDDDGRTALRVREVYTQLNDYIPILDAVEHFSLFDAGNMADIFARRPIVQYRQGPHRPKKLLFGRDVLAEIPVTASRATQALAEISLWWEFLVEHRRRGAAAASHRGNVTRKMLADVYRAILWDTTGEYVAKRRDVLDRLEATHTVDPALLAIARQPLGAAPLPFARLLAAFHGLIKDYLGAEVPTTARLRTDWTAWARFMGAADLGPLKERFGAEAVVPVPNFFFTPEPLSAVHPGTQRRVHLRLGRLPTETELQDLDALHASHPALHLFFEADGVAYPVGRERLHGLNCRARTPELFTGGRVDQTRLDAIRHIFAVRDADAGEVIRSRRLRKLDSHDLINLVASAAEARRAVRGGELEIMTSPAELTSLGDDPVLAQAAALLDRGRRVTDEDLPVPLLHDVVRFLTGLYGAPAPAGDALRTALTISVVIITRNRAHLLRGAMQSIAAQQRPPEELVIVDNGSSDDTRAVAESFAGALNVVYRYLAEPSIPKARNLGARTATREIICYFDDDQVMDPSWLLRAERTFLRDPGIGVVGGASDTVDEQEGIIADFYRKYMRD